jgi:energy-coupling factor transporter ATP-binding protein EcfA2
LRKIRYYSYTRPLIERLYIKCFYKAIDEHNKHYDDFSAKILKKISKEIKKDELKLLRSITQDGNIFLSSFNRKEFHILVSEEIVNTYSIDVGNYPKLIPGIVADCFSYYVSSFYNLMNEKEGIQAILMECLKLNNILDLLNKIDQQIVTKNEFDNLRKIVYTYFVDNNLDYKKSIKDYDSYLKNKFKYLELRGFSPKISGKEVQMELEDIFVPLAINKQQKIVPNILEESINDTENTFKSIEILNHSALVILGDPGSGKSTLQKYLATQIVGLRKSDHVLKNIIPIFFRLADYSDFYKQNKKSIYEFITNHFDNQYQHIYRESFEYSNMLILMDGLDEIAETPLRLKVTEQVMDLIARYPNNRYIVTSRVVGYQESKLGGAFAHYKLLPFRKEEIQIFSDQWYKSIANHTDRNFKHSKQQSENLYNSIFRNPSVLKLATNPLLMTIISMIHYQGKKLPSKRVELYEISTETFLEHWVQLRITDEKQLKDKAEIIEILAPIAFEIHKTKSNALIEESEFRKEFLKYFQGIHTNTSLSEAKQTCNEFIQFLRQQTGFFYEKGVDDDGNRFYGFMHLTFEEYLAAIEFVSKWSENEIELKDYIFQPRWTEIIRLAASQIRLSFKGKAGRTQTSNFIKDLLNVNDDFKDSYRQLQLASLIISDDVSINDNLQNEIFNDLIDVLSNTEHVSLIKAISKLFSELLLSDKQAYFIEGIRSKFTVGDNLLLKNLSTVLIENSEFPSVLTLIKENSNNPILLKEVIKVRSHHQIRNEEFYREILKKEIFNTEIQINCEDDYWILRTNILTLIGVQEFSSELKNLKTEKISNLLENIKDKNSYNLALKVLIDFVLTSISRNEGVISMLEALNKQIDHPYLINVINSFKEIDITSIQKFSYSKSSVVRLSKEIGILLEKDSRLGYFSWNKDFSSMVYNQIENSEIEDYFKTIKNTYSKDDYEQLKFSIYFINGPKENRDNLANFIHSYKSDNLRFFDFFNWEDFPFFEISNEPDVISEIIIKNSRNYLLSRHVVEFKNKIDYKAFCTLDIPPPVKLLASIKTSQPYNSKLINDSIDYYNSCNQDLKKGVFEILFNVLNITNTTDNK